LQKRQLMYIKKPIITNSGDSMENMWGKIGEIAGKVYHLLEEGEKSLSNLTKILRKEGYSTNVVIMAIGWLAREDKINVIKDNKKWIISLK